ncbi:MAG: hypothetical protein OEM82_12805, partial [Acidobacteriota bacterium]|nr:hypothetical protein [Acidobacteriota bacterium]
TAVRDLQRSQTFYAASAGMEKMTSDFSDLFKTKLNPTPADLVLIESSPPPELITEGFTFNQSLQEDAAKLNELRTLQGLPANIYPRVNLPSGPYAGLYASIVPYKMSSTATMDSTGTEVELERDFNNYLVPLFQFGIFSNDDIEVHPGPLMTFNGRVHGNKNIYALRNTKFLSRLTMSGEFVRDAWRSGAINTSAGNNNVWVEVNGINVKSTLGNGSVKPGSGYVGGPNFPGTSSGDRGYHPGSPNGVANGSWETESVKPAASGVNNRFGGQVLTNTTGASELKMPLELSGNSAAEIVKRELPSDTAILTDARYHSKSKLRILIDDWDAGSGATNVAGIPAGKGVQLSSFVPIKLGTDGALRRVSDAGSYLDSPIKQKMPDSTIVDAKIVRGVKAAGEASGMEWIPPGSGLNARILIEIVRPDGTALDVTTEILSMGMTVGEPNGIVYLQRPMWAAFIQGSRDRAGNGTDLVTLTQSSSRIIFDGEIKAVPTFDADTGHISDASLDDEVGTVTREAAPPNVYDAIYPISVYNVREGWYQSTMFETDVYERGITSVVDINMRNLARWLDGVYDSNLLAGTNAVSTNIDGTEGYIVYFSDRRGDQKKVEYLSDGSSFVSTNGIVDNEDIYENGTLDEGEDVIDFGWGPGGVSKKGTLQKDLTELPSVGWKASSAGYPDLRAQALGVLQRPVTYFRRSARLFNAANLTITGSANKLSTTKGITFASENMVYIWGNYNTTGVSSIPAGGSTLNNGGYMGPQVPSSIVCDAFFPLSRTWFDGLSAWRPEGSSDPRNMLGTAYRMADEGSVFVSEGTAVRAGIIGGTTISSMTASPGRDSVGDRRSGGIVNYPRFLEIWGLNGNIKTWSYSGSFVALFPSTQAVAQWENKTSVIYMPPRRNWSFDETFLTPNKIPPGTPFFQYVQATGFRQILR